MPTSPLRNPALLDVCAVLGLGGVAVQIAFGAAAQGPTAVLVSGAALAASIVLWIVWRRMPRLAVHAAVGFAACAVVVLMMGSGPMTFGAVWLATLMLSTSLGTSATVTYIVVLCLMSIALHVTTGRGPAAAVSETLATLVLGGLGAAFALVLRDAGRVERERAVMSDERAAALVELQAANVELQRSLGSEHDLVVAEERERTARELHDGLGHRLTAIGLSLDYAQRMQGRDADRAFDEVARARMQVGEALEAMRRIVRAMHPIELRAARGPAAFHAIADAFRSTGLDVRVETHGVDDLPHEQSLLLVRFVQEGLTNVVRHGVATRAVDVRVAASPQGIEATVVDHGTAVGEGVDGFGLRSLRARASAAGGELEARPTDDGFVLALALPAAHEVVA